MPAPLAVVWLKRDLRVVDHAPLYQAWLSGAPVLPLYVFEPELWQQPDASGRHGRFIYDSLVALDQALASLQSQLFICHGAITSVLTTLIDQGYAPTLYSHQETGHGPTFQRDQAVAHFCRTQGIDWHQPKQHPIQRGGQTQRDHWAAQAQAFFQQPLWPTPPALGQCPVTLPQRLSWRQLAQAWPQDEALDPQARQQGGRLLGKALLETFLRHRHRRYLRTLSKPAYEGQFSSRLSPHLAYGTLSIREVIQAAQASLRSGASDPPSTKDLQAFIQRLHWQSHFMQKLETEPALSHQALHPAMRSLTGQADPKKYQAWQSGQTGYPLVDACMRCVAATGWLPFRMRALVMSFASYQLNLPWQTTAAHLAQCFTDFEPGIHYPQAQMQSGMTGINALRVYNPFKQSVDQDPEGQFIAKWVTELAPLPAHWRHTPWELPVHQREALQTQTGYPFEPLVWHDTAARWAKDQRAQRLKTPQARQASKKVYQRHGSRRSAQRRKKPPSTRPDSPQMALF